MTFKRILLLLLKKQRQFFNEIVQTIIITRLYCTLKFHTRKYQRGNPTNVKHVKICLRCCNFIWDVNMGFKTICAVIINETATILQRNCTNNNNNEIVLYTKVSQLRNTTSIVFISKRIWKCLYCMFR